jgi:uncharacterized protein YjbI with pentapeptide repeats
MNCFQALLFLSTVVALNSFSLAPSAKAKTINAATHLGTSIPSDTIRFELVSTLFALALVVSPATSLAVSGGGLDFAGIDISGQDFSNGNYKGKDFTQGKKFLVAFLAVLQAIFSPTKIIVAI